MKKRLDGIELMNKKLDCDLRFCFDGFMSSYNVWCLRDFKSYGSSCLSRNIVFWALSLVGRALALHARGQGFDSPRVQILFNGEMAERSIASDCKSDVLRLRRFESYSPQTGVPIVQWIEQQPSKLWIQVRSLVGIDELYFGLSWSSGLGRHPLTVEIEGSSPSGSGCVLFSFRVYGSKKF